MKPTIVFFGSDQFVVQVLEALEDNFQVVGVVTSVDSPISKHFKGLVLTPDKLDEEFMSELKNLSPDLIVVSSYGKIIPQIILDIPKYGAINVHPSLLPKFRGASPVPAVILSGDKQTGVTIIKMDEKMDHGPIIITKQISLSEQEDTPELINKLFHLGSELLIKVIPDFLNGKVKLKEQEHDKATFCKLMTKEDGYFPIDDPPSTEVLDRMIRAYTPWPGVWTLFHPSGSKGQARIVKLLPNGMIQMEGKKVMPLLEFLKGYSDFPLKEL